jgi:hypothetical protein
VRTSPARATSSAIW